MPVEVLLCVRGWESMTLLSEHMGMAYSPSPLMPQTLLPPKTKPNYYSFQRQKQITDKIIPRSLSAYHSHLYFPNDPVNSSTYASLLQSCKCPLLGKQVHAHSLKCGFNKHQFVETKLLQMYGKCGLLEDAAFLFDNMPLRNIYAWTAILDVCLDHGLYEKALLLFQELQFEDFELEFFVFPIVLKICSRLGRMELGSQLHGIVVKNGFVSNIYVGNALIDMYGKCRDLDCAKKVFDYMSDIDCVSWNSIITAYTVNRMVYEALEFLDRMSFADNSTPNNVSWSALIAGFSQNGYDEEAIEMLHRMQAAGFEPNEQTLASVLPTCAKLKKLTLGKEIHGYIVRRGFMTNRYLINGLLDVYRRCMDMETALKIFSEFSVKNAGSFNTMIVGYYNIGEISCAEELFKQMDLAGVKKDIISWNSMISGYVDNFMFYEALSVFQDLLEEDGMETNSFTLGSALTACANIGSLKHGKEIHAHAIIRGLQSNPFVGGALVEMYIKCLDLKLAQKAFDGVSEREASTWNALIFGYSSVNHINRAQILLQIMKEDGFEPTVYTWNGIIAGQVENGENESALQLFSTMQASNLRPDIYTVGTILPACSKLATIERGKQVHAYSIRCGYESDDQIGAALVDMYAKCGSIKHALVVYNRITQHNLVTKNAMLTAFAMHRHGEEGINFFRKMLVEGFRPDEVTFLSVLSSCVHAGSVEIGQEFYNLMRFYNVSPTLKHYTCMVNLLSRSGQLDEAYEAVKKMAWEPDSVIWGALLGGCVIHGNVDLGEVAAERLIELEPENTGNYVMLANLYASAGKWSELASTREIIKHKQMRKSPGCSWIEDRDEIHVFTAYDRSHKKVEEIYTTLNNLTHVMRQESRGNLYHFE